MKFKYIKLAHAIRCGGKEVAFISSTTHDAELERDYVVKITEKYSKAVSYTTLFNTIYWETLDEPSSPSAKAPAAQEAPSLKSKVPR